MNKIDLSLLATALSEPKPSLEHHDFVRMLRESQIDVYVDKNQAGFLYGAESLMPDRLRTQQAMVRTIAFTATLGGIASFFFTVWWIALGILIFGLAMFPRAQSLAAKGVLEESISNPYVYAVACARGVLHIKNR